MPFVERGFDSKAEAVAFEAGIEYANDSSIEPQGIDERAVDGRTVFVVVLLDKDAETDLLWPREVPESEWSGGE